MHIYLIKRGPKPPCHNAPFHPVIACGKKRDGLMGFGRKRPSYWPKAEKVGAF